MKICMITQSNYPGDPRVKREAEALERRGHSVDVISMGEKTNPKQQSYGAVTAYRVLPSLRQENLFRYLFVALSFFVKAFIKLQRLHRLKKYDLIQIHNMPDWLVFSAFIQKNKGVPVILDIHDLTPELFDSKWKGSLHSFFSAFVKYSEKVSCRFADEVITVTEGCKDRLVQRGVPEEKVTLVLNTPDTEIFKYEPAKKFDVINENLTMIYHGTMAERFGVHVAVKSTAILKKHIPGVKLLLYGKYEHGYYHELVELIDKLDLKENVSLNKSVPLEQIAGIVKHCHLGVVPYLSTPYMNLALSTKTFEYAGAGLPVVATRLETLEKTFNSNSIEYTEPDSPDDLAGKILALCADPLRRKILTVNAYRSLENISGDVMSRRYVSLVENTVNDRRARFRKNYLGAESRPSLERLRFSRREKKKENEYINEL